MRFINRQEKIFAVISFSQKKFFFVGGLSKLAVNPLYVLITTQFENQIRRIYALFMRSIKILD